MKSLIFIFLVGSSFAQASGFKLSCEQRSAVGVQEQFPQYFKPVRNNGKWIKREITFAECKLAPHGNAYFCELVAQYPMDSGTGDVSFFAVLSKNCEHILRSAVNGEE